MAAMTDLSSPAPKAVSITGDTLPTVVDTNRTAWAEAAGLGANLAVVIDSSLTVTDPDNTTLASAGLDHDQVVSGEDVLGFTANPALYGNIAAV